AELLERACRARPTDVWSRLFLANTMWKLGRLEEADAWYLEAIWVEGSDSLPTTAYAEFLWTTDRLDDAERHFRRAVETWPEEVRIVVRPAEDLNSQGRRGEAEQMVSQLLGNPAVTEEDKEALRRAIGA